MSVKKIYSDYQSKKLIEIYQLQNKVDELTSLDEGYYIAQRDAHNQKERENWLKKKENYQKYCLSYYDIKNKLNNLSADSILFEYYKIYELKNITGRALSAYDILTLNSSEKDALLNPEYMKIEDEPIQIADLQIFKEPVNKNIKELEHQIKSMKNELASLTEKSQNTPIFLSSYLSGGYKGRVINEWLYQDTVYDVQGGHSNDEICLLVLEFSDKERRKFERLKNKYSGKQSDEIKHERTRIPEEVRIAVWRRDQGKCAKCGSRENLEYDHIVPVSKGGGNTERNIELLCQDCNRAKGNRIE